MDAQSIPPPPPGFQLEGQAPQKPVGDIATTIQEPIGALITGSLAIPVSGYGGLLTAAANKLGLTDANPADVVGKIQSAMMIQPRTRAGEMANSVVSYPFEKLAQGADWVGGKVSDITGSPLAGAGANASIQALPALLGLRGKSSPRGNSGPPVLDRPPVPRQEKPAAPIAEKAGRQAGLESVPAKPPTIDELKVQAKAAYKKAEDAGVMISGNALNNLKTRIVTDLRGIDPTLHPDATAALKRITSTKGNISLQELDTLRQIASDAQGSIKPADARLAGRIVDQIDEFVDKLDSKQVTAGDAAGAAALKEARSLYSRQKKAEEIKRLFDRAEITAPNFSGSGMENALRTEFRALAKNDRKMKRFTPEERAAILKVAKGGPMENILRMMGKFAPTGVVSAGLSSGAGLVLGGPAGAVGLPAVGAVSRAAATRLTMGNAARAEEIMRAGPEQTRAAVAKQAEKKKNALANF